MVHTVKGVDRRGLMMMAAAATRGYAEFLYALAGT